MSPFGSMFPRWLKDPPNQLAISTRRQALALACLCRIGHAARRRRGAQLLRLLLLLLSSFPLLGSAVGSEEADGEEQEDNDDDGDDGDDAALDLSLTVVRAAALLAGGVVVGRLSGWELMAAGVWALEGVLECRHREVAGM